MLLSLRDMPVNKRLHITETVLREPIMLILAQRGPLESETLAYLLEREADLEISDNSIVTVLRTLERQRHVKQIQLGQNHNFKMVWCLPEDEAREPTIPVPYNYHHAYIELYMRYQAIRNNPALATAPESLIDDLFNPGRPA